MGANTIRDPVRPGPGAHARTALGAGLALLLALGCASTAEVRKLERDLRSLKASQGSGPGPGAAQVADLAVRMDALEDRIKELQGWVEQVEHRTQTALEEAQVARTEAAEARGEADTARRQAAELASSTEALQRRTREIGARVDRWTPTGVRSEAAGAPLTPSGSASAAAPSQGGASGAEAGAGAIPEAPVRPQPAVTQAPNASAGEIEAYRAAYAAWRNDDTRACIDQFRQFLQTHESSPFADDAAFWMADCYFKQGDYKTAILRFDDVVSRYPTGNKAADALYRQGEALLRLGPGYAKAAGKAFQRVLREYPESDRAIEARRQIEILGSG